MKLPWEEGFWPEWVWVLMTNIGLLVAIVAAISAIGYLWRNGPGLLVKYGPEWMSRLGRRWSGKLGSKHIPEGSDREPT